MFNVIIIIHIVVCEKYSSFTLTSILEVNFLSGFDLHPGGNYPVLPGPSSNPEVAIMAYIGLDPGGSYPVLP